MKVKFKIILSLLSVVSIGCKAQNVEPQNMKDVYKIVNAQLEILDTYDFYKKSYIVNKSRFYFSNDIFKCQLNYANFNLARKKTDSIKKLSIPIKKKETLLKDIEKTFIQVDIGEYISEDDFNTMRNNLSDKSIKWNKSLIDRELTKKNDKQTIKLSVPVFTDKGNYAIMFVEFFDSLQAHIFKKDDDGWSFYCLYPKTFYNNIE
ncbi:hypothetical protein [Allomuricauda sp. d1]|uniref:hypothetical protein n=1 Tax=Allomuricauda sp. d1 TaxID=3136725 RepID=UPI0031D9B518